MIFLFVFFSNFVANSPLKMAKVGANVELSGLLAVGGISVATLMWDHHSNHGRVLATLQKSFSALGKFLFGEANEKSAKTDEGNSKTKSPPKKKTPDADGRKITDGILQGKSGIPSATDGRKIEEDADSGWIPVVMEENPGKNTPLQTATRNSLSGNTHLQVALLDCKRQRGKSRKNALKL